ncbi:endospore germination permease [Paenibacillus sp. y28]
MEKGKISSGQMGVLLYPAIIATAVLAVPSITMKLAGHDMWMSPIWALPSALGTLLIAFRLNRHYPGKSFVESSYSILGSVGGRLFGLLYMFYLPHLNGIILREYGEFILSTVLSHTPLFVVMGTLMLICAVNVRSGIEVIGRSGQLLVGLMVVLLTLILLLLVPEMEPEQFLPFMEKGVKPSFLGAISPASWFSEYILVSFLLPFVSDRSKALRASLRSVGFVLASMLAVNISCLLLFGDTTDSYVYPVMIAARFISFADFLQHLEALIVAIWVAGIFVKISLFHYVHAVTAAQWLKLEDYRPLVFPLAFLTTVYSYWVVGNQTEAGALVGAGGNLYTLFMLLVIPGILWAISEIKERLHTRRAGP